MKTLYFTLLTLLLCNEIFAQRCGQHVENSNIESVEDKQTKNFNLYPNPPKNLVTLEPRTAFRGYAEICSIEGKLIKKTRLKSEEILDIDIRNLSAGQYLIKISDQDFQPTEIFKFLKQ